MIRSFFSSLIKVYHFKRFLEYRSSICGGSCIEGWIVASEWRGADIWNLFWDMALVSRMGGVVVAPGLQPPTTIFDILVATSEFFTVKRVLVNCWHEKWRCTMAWQEKTAANGVQIGMIVSIREAFKARVVPWSLPRSWTWRKAYSIHTYPVSYIVDLVERPSLVKGPPFNTTKRPDLWRNWKHCPFF